jgi:hypothetical protein
VPPQSMPDSAVSLVPLLHVAAPQVRADSTQKAEVQSAACGRALLYLRGGGGAALFESFGREAVVAAGYGP